MEDKDRFVDELLDSALAQQRRAEPRAGLEGRILERVRAARSVRASSRKRWIVEPALAAASVVLIGAIYVVRRPHSPPVQTPPNSNAVSAPAPAETLTASSGATPNADTSPRVAEAKRTVRHERKPARRVQEHHWPSQFPTPAPLSPEEKALVRYVRETPPQVLAQPIFKAGLTVQRVEIKPLKIAPLEIPPLAVGSTGEEIQ
jgi:hypothetical protein